MKQLEQLVARGRAAARRLQARAPVGQPAPERLLIRLNEQRSPADWLTASEEPMDLHAWQRSLVLLLEWLGPIRVVFSGGEPAESELLSRLVRFCNRLECPTQLVTAGGLEPVVLEELVDWGLASATVQTASLNDSLHRSLVGTGLDEAAATLEGLARIRQDRGRPMMLLVSIPLVEENLESVAAIAGWARQCGADGVLASVPAGGTLPPGAREAIASIGESNRTPDAIYRLLDGAPLQLPPQAILLSDGSLMASPSGPILCRLPDTEPAASWSQVSGSEDRVDWFDASALVPKQLVSRR